MGNQTADNAGSATETPAHVVQLSRAISAHGHETKVLEFREPNGEDIVECGMPFDIVQEGKKTRIVINASAVGAYVARLADIPPSSVKQLSAGDFIACFNKVMGFFGDVKVET